MWLRFKTAILAVLIYIAISIAVLVWYFIGYILWILAVAVVAVMVAMSIVHADQEDEDNKKPP